MKNQLCTVYSIISFGCMTVYERTWKRDSSTPKYFVVNSYTERTLEEFRRKQSAINWARANQNG